MDLTTNLGLQNPNQNEIFDIDVQNSNMDIIDEFAVIAKADLEKLLARYNSEADWIVEQKTSGIWTYRKWNSGVAECWADDITSSATASAEGSVFWTRASEYSFPSGLFIEAPTVNISVGCGPSYLTICSIRILTKDTISWYYIHDTSAARGTIYNNINAKGRWK